MKVKEAIGLFSITSLLTIMVPDLYSAIVVWTKSCMGLHNVCDPALLINEGETIKAKLQTAKKQYETARTRTIARSALWSWVKEVKEEHRIEAGYNIWDSVFPSEKKIPPEEYQHKVKENLNKLVKKLKEKNERYLLSRYPEIVYVIFDENTTLTQNFETKQDAEKEYEIYEERMVKARSSCDRAKQLWFLVRNCGLPFITTFFLLTTSYKRSAIVLHRFLIPVTISHLNGLFMYHELPNPITLLADCLPLAIFTAPKFYDSLLLPLVKHAHRWLSLTRSIVANTKRDIISMGRSARSTLSRWLNPTEADEEAPTCIICQDRRPEVVLIPCGHMNLCDPCARDWKNKRSLGRGDEIGGECPTCRRKIKRIQKFFPH